MLLSEGNENPEEFLPKQAETDYETFRLLQLCRENNWKVSEEVKKRWSLHIGQRSNQTKHPNPVSAIKTSQKHVGMKP